MTVEDDIKNAICIVDVVDGYVECVEIVAEEGYGESDELPQHLVGFDVCSQDCEYFLGLNEWERNGMKYVQVRCGYLCNMEAIAATLLQKAKEQEEA